MPELQDTKEYIAATEKKTRKRPQREKREANYELPQPYGRAKDAHNVSRNDLSRLCKYDPLGSITILHMATDRPRPAPEKERPVLAIQPHLVAIGRKGRRRYQSHADYKKPMLPRNVK